MGDLVRHDLVAYRERLRQKREQSAPVAPAISRKVVKYTVLAVNRRRKEEDIEARAAQYLAASQEKVQQYLRQGLHVGATVLLYSGNIQGEEVVVNAIASPLIAFVFANQIFGIEVLDLDLYVAPQGIVLVHTAH